MTSIPSFMKIGQMIKKLIGMEQIDGQTDIGTHTHTHTHTQA
jgi:hypothetical protein